MVRRAHRATLRTTELQLLVAPALMMIVGLLTIFFAGRGEVDWAWTDIWVSLAYVGAMFGISLSFGLVGFRGDQMILPVALTLAGFGLLMIQRLQADLTALDEGYAGLAERQLLYLSIGLGLMWVTVVLFRHLNVLRRFKYSALMVSLGLMVATVLFGREIYGAKLYISIGPLQAQPSEIAKVGLVLFLAAYLEDNRELMAGSYRIGRLRLPPLPYLLPMVLMWAACLMILVVQNDLGTALLFFGIFVSMLYVASGRIVYVSLAAVSFMGASWLAYRLFGRIGIRVQNWLDPWQDPLDTGLQQVQSDYAMAAGGIFGTGLGLGQPWRIPIVETDYVFSLIGEELGAIGTLGVLALVFTLVLRGYVVALTRADGYARYVAVGLSTILGFQTLIIVGGVVRLLPLTGITLPFISYGGSSLLTNFIIVGLLLHISGLPARTADAPA
ncbi:MAG: FtsW-like cell division membrane protein CA_C0505 [uncultured Thermomicrobiales bacterium]|uniref:FtsW-like cell division membrane protein CA_C0505 n=1 Tax=uncultured Thermomicrobiales bacterium TaxID=1645740 RepID=A0A6J4V0S2_9BACT|nr:MAG: FtsW-like cell division membrane protein CA_C0505 [uncultured Thermomicrobiales bacterium]